MRWIVPLIAIPALLALPAVPATAATTLPPTRVILVDYPTATEAHKQYAHDFSDAIVQYWNGSAWQPLGNQIANLFYRRKGSSTWHDMGSWGPTTADGRVQAQLPIILGSTYWQWRVTDQVVANFPVLGEPSASATFHIAVKDRTWFIRTPDVTRWHGRACVNGELVDAHNNPPNQESFADMGRRKIELYERRKGTKKWHLVRTVRTKHVLGGGDFSLHCVNNATHDVFQVRFPGNSVLLPLRSKVLKGHHL